MLSGDRKILAGLWVGCYWGLSLFCSQVTQAQVIPDDSLGDESSRVTSQGTIDGITTDLIEGGAIRADNLFHSFAEFSIPNGSSVYFTHPDGVANILTRVTGEGISNIAGKLGVNGTANLFLLNPQGIIFGENSALDINGSFVATTADSFVFDRDLAYSANNPQQPPLLTVNLTPGLQINNDDGKIIVKGNGHQLTGGGFFPLNNNNPAKLQANKERTLSLIAGKIELDGGILATPGGKLELVGIRQGKIPLVLDATNISLDTSQIEQFGDIELKNRSLLDAGGVLTGNIQLYAQNIDFTGASAAIIQNLGLEPSGKIYLNAQGSVTLSDSIRNSPDITVPKSSIPITGVASSRLTTETLGLGKAGNIEIAADNLFLAKSSSIFSRSYSNADTGNLELAIAKSLSIDGTSILNPILPSRVGTAIFDRGNSGTININARNIKISDGGTLSSLNFGSGRGGDINITVVEELKFDGVNPFDGNPSTLGSTVYRSGDSSNVIINASKILLVDGARLSTSTLGEGDAGQLKIYASERIEVSSMTPDLRFNSNIASDAPVIDSLLQTQLGLPDFPKGDSGNLIIDTPLLILSQGGVVAVSNQGLGNSGKLTINSDRLILDDNASIAAFSASGQGGNIELRVGDWLSLNGNSSVNAQTTADLRANNPNINGGNIQIESDVITLTNNSQINANARDGNGGNIDIISQGFFVSQDSSISASSELGLDGNINVENIKSDRVVELDSLPNNFVTSAEHITAGCNSRSSFAIAGKGGLPDNPLQELRGNSLWQDLRLPSFESAIQTKSKVSNSLNNPQAIEAQSWKINQQGKVELVGDSFWAVSFNRGDRCLD